MGIAFEGISGAILMSLISFSIVFLVCGGLILVMTALKHFANSLERAGKNKSEVAATVAEKAALATRETSLPSTPEEMDCEIVAIITAAIVASCGTASKIVSIAPTAQRYGATTWSTTGRLENCEGF